METRSWKHARALTQDKNCRLCNKYEETVVLILMGCTPLAVGEYLMRHNKALEVVAVEWAKKVCLLNDNACSYKVDWKKGKVMEGSWSWDFEFKMHKTRTARRPALILKKRIGKEDG